MMRSSLLLLVIGFAQIQSGCFRGGFGYEQEESDAGDSGLFPGDATDAHVDGWPDATSPIPLLSSIVPHITNISPIPVSVDFRGNVTGFAQSDLVVTNGIAALPSGGPQVYTFNVAPMGDGEIWVDLPAAVVKDLDGNDNLAASRLVRTYDGTAPTPVFSSASDEVRSGLPISVSVDFNEDVTGFNATDLVITNGSTATIFGGPQIYTFNVTPLESEEVRIRLPDAHVQDLAGNDNLAAIHVIRPGDDTIGPTATISTTETSPTTATVIPFTVGWDEVTLGFTSADVTVTNGTVSGFSGGPELFTFDIIVDTDGAVDIEIAAGSVEDESGNPCSAADYTLMHERTIASYSTEWHSGWSSMTHVEAGDFDGDSDEDFMISNSTEQMVRIYANDGSASFVVAKEWTGYDFLRPTFADLQNDGDLDLVTARSETMEICLKLNRGDGTFDNWYCLTVPPGPGAQHVGQLEIGILDLDGDTFLDLVVPGEEGGGRLWIYTTDSAGAMTGPTTYDLPTDTLSFAFRVADVNGDTLMDLVGHSIHWLTSVPTADYYVLFNDGAGGFSGHTSFASQDSNGSYAFCVVDVNDDTIPDAVTTGIAGTIWVHINDGSGNFEDRPSFDYTHPDLTTYYIHDGNCVDYNEDGRIDIITAQANRHISYGDVQGIYVLPNNGDGTMGPASRYDGPHIYAWWARGRIATSDFDGDAHLDVIHGSNEDGYLSLILGPF